MEGVRTNGRLGRSGGLVSRIGLIRGADRSSELPAIKLAPRSSMRRLMKFTSPKLILWRFGSSLVMIKDEVEGI